MSGRPWKVENAPASTAPITRSGCPAATRWALQEPIEWPATIARSMPAASMQSITSAAICAAE